MNKLSKEYKKLPIQIRASIWFLICSFFQKGIQVITTPIFTRLLSTAEFGQYNVFNSWLGVITVFVSMRLYFGVYTQGLVKFESEKKIYSSSLQGLTLTLELAWISVYFLFKNIWLEIFRLTHPQMLILLMMIWTTSIFNFWAAEQRIEYNYRQLVLVTCLASLLKPILAILLVINSTDKVTSLVLGFLIIEVLCYICLFIKQMVKGKVFFSKRYWKYALCLGIPLIPHYLSQTVLTSFDRIMIERMVGSSEAGIYGLAYSISQVMALFNTALTQTIEPWIYKKIKCKDIDQLGRVAYPAMIIIASVNIMLIAVAPEIVKIFAPAPYYEAIWVIPPVVMSVYYGFLYCFFADFEFYYEKTKHITIATVAVALLNIILNYVFIDIFGYIAASYTTLVCYILYALFHFLSMERIRINELKCESIYDNKLIMKVSLIFMIIGFCFMFTYTLPFFRYTGIVLLIVIIFIKRNYFIDVIRSFIELRR